MNKKEITRVLNYMPLAHMFGCGTIVVITYTGMSLDLLLMMKIFFVIFRWRNWFLAR
jgi:hypothetical protein